jgi:beta-lactamase superfamily II metal-dependent hydrolase
MKRVLISAAAAVVFSIGLLAAQGTSSKPLEIYVVDVEGGKADLWVTPSGQSLLVDTGSPGGRDTDRIMEVMKAAGVTKLDYLLLTHYHVDHVGGVQELVSRLPPIAHYLDHGPTVEDGKDGHQREQVAGFQAAYAELYGKAQHTVLKPGDRIPIPGLDWRIVTSAGEFITTPLPGGGQPNPACAGTTRETVARDPENGQSVGSVVSFGAFRALDFADLTKDVEHDLMCPNNPIGTVDLFFASNHGSNNANSTEFIHGIQPRVAIVQNSSFKGASPEMFEALRSSPGFEDVWQLHWSNPGGLEWNSPGALIANGVDPQEVATALTAPPRARGGRRGMGAGGMRGGGAPGAAGAPAARGGAPQAGAGPQAGGRTGGPAGGGFGRGRGPGAGAHTPAYWIKVTVQPDGTYTVTNSRNDFSRTYTPVAKSR